METKKNKQYCDDTYLIDIDHNIVQKAKIIFLCQWSAIFAKMSPATMKTKLKNGPMSNPNWESEI